MTGTTILAIIGILAALTWRMGRPRCTPGLGLGADWAARPASLAGQNIISRDTGSVEV